MRARWRMMTGMAVVLAATVHGAVLTYDPFTEPGTWANSTLHLTTNGFGWLQGWDVQGESNYGYAITNAPAMWYEVGGRILITNGNVAAGGDSWTSSGRRLNVRPDWEPDNEYTPYRRMIDFQAYVGKDNTELWLAALVRQQANNNDYQIQLHASNIAWFQSEPRISIGLNSGVWELQVVTGGVTTAASTGISRVLNQTYLMVLRMTFGAASDTVRLYVNPSSLLTLPGTADAEVTVDDVYFRSFRFYPGSGQNNGYIDEVRIGESYTDVVPSIPEPAALMVGALALGVLARRRG